jgi:nitrogenase molybdenum-iron protein alpha/beta subunit
MDAAEFLSPDDTIERQPPDKRRLLSELASLAAKKVALPADRIAAALTKREAAIDQRRRALHGKTDMLNGSSVRSDGNVSIISWSWANGIFVTSCYRT